MRQARHCAFCRGLLGDWSRSVGLRRVCSLKCQRALAAKLERPRKCQHPRPWMRVKFPRVVERERVYGLEEIGLALRDAKRGPKIEHRWGLACRSCGAILRRPRKPLPSANRKRLRRLRAEQYGGKIFTDAIRASGCAVARADKRETGLRGPCAGPIQVAHVRSSGAGGKAERNVVGLCLGHHSLRGTMGIRSFQAFFRVDLAAEAARLWREHGHLAGRAAR